MPDSTGWPELQNFTIQLRSSCRILRFFKTVCGVTVATTLLVRVCQVLMWENKKCENYKKLLHCFLFYACPKFRWPTCRPFTFQRYSSQRSWGKMPSLGVKDGDLRYRSLLCEGKLCPFLIFYRTFLQAISVQERFSQNSREEDIWMAVLSCKNPLILGSCVFALFFLFM